VKYTFRIQCETPQQVQSRYHAIGIRPRMPGFGAWIDGVDLAAELAAEVRLELRKALLDFGVLFFRDQARLAPQTQAALASVFGGGPYDGNAQLQRAQAHPDVELLVSDEQRPPYADSWHTDISWKRQPPLGTLIQIQERPPLGGNTCWTCTRKAFACLSPGMQLHLQGLRAVHAHVSPRILSERSFSTQKVEAVLRSDPPVTHPVVITHPLTGQKALYVNELWTVTIEGLHPAEARGLLRMLHEWTRQPEFQLHHEWETNGVAVWDNYTTQHYAHADYYPAYRLNQRLTFSVPSAVAA